MLLSFSARCTLYWTSSFVRIKWQLQLPPYKGANHFKGIHEALSRAGLSIPLIPGLSIPLIPWNRLSRHTAKPAKWHVRQVKTQIILGIHPVWSEKSWVRDYPLSVQRRLWSDWANAQADLRLRRAHVSFCLFCLAPVQLLCFPVAQNQHRHFLRSLFSKIGFVPLFTTFLYLSSLVPWNKWLWSRVP